MSSSDTGMSALAWRKASRSVGNGECVEIASATGYVAIRDSKNPEGGMLRCTPTAFRSFLDAITRDEASR
jgi:Domain of unknown function (DUF397)